MEPPPTIELHSKPFKVGRAKASTKSARKPAVGCPVYPPSIEFRGGGGSIHEFVTVHIVINVSDLNVSL